MIRFVAKSIFLIAFSVLCSAYAIAQTTINFNDLSDGLIGTTYSREGFTFSVNLTNGRVIQSKAVGGFGNSATLWDNNPTIGALTQWKIVKNGGTEFQFRSVYLRDAGFGANVSGTIQGFKNNVSTGPAVSINFNGVSDLAGNSQFYDVDEIRINGSDLNFYLDEFIYGPVYVPVDTDPTAVTSIILVGSPLTTATSVSYAVSFSKTAKNVSSDDFVLTTAGTTGTVGAVSGSGSSYTVAVNGIDGEGTVRLDLKGGTNIANADDITGTPAFTSGQLHYVSACFVETFETETDASKTFSGNGVNFSLGTGFEIEKRTGFGAGNSNGYIINNNTAGSFSLTSGSEFTMSTIDLFLSDRSVIDEPSATGSITITGKKGGVDQYTITKNSGFPTTTTVNGGFFTINFSTDGAANYRNINVDELVFTISGGFIELAVDNMNFCEAALNVDTQAPVVQSISKTGSPLSTAGTVNFQVTFDENASNVTLDDFTLLKTGTATGALTGISGSGSIYTLSVTGISGEGSVQIKLNSGTDIADALGNTPPFEYLNGEIHLVGACYIETFESFTNGSTSFSSNGKAITLGGNWAVKDRSGFGINGSDVYLENTGSGPYSLTVDIPVKFSKLALFLTSNTGTNPLPTNDGTVTIRGKNGATTVYTITKSTGFPTDFSSNNGFFYIDFATEGGADNSTTFVDGLEIETGGSFIYLALDNLQFCGDFDAPTGYTVSIDQDPINAGNSSAVGFTFADAEIGATYNYTFSTSGGATTATGSGTIASATDQITGIDLSGLEDGTITLSVTLTDPSGNTGDPATDTSVKAPNNAPVATPPTAPVVTEDDVAVALADDIQVADGDGDDQVLTFTITGGTVTLGTTDITFGGSGNGSASFTATGTLAAINTALDAATFTPTPNLFGSNVGTIAFVANDGTINSNSASVTFDISGVNDDPTFTGIPSSITITEDVPSALNNALSDGTFNDSDAGANDVSLFLVVDKGNFGFANPAPYSINIIGNATGNATITGTATNIETYLNINTNVVYNPPLNLNGTNAAVITLTANDNGNTGSGGGTNVSFGSINVDITAVNDDPTLIGLPTDISVEENLASDVDLSAATFGDVDAGSNNIDLEIAANVGTLTGSGGGLTVIGSGTGTLTLNGTAANIDAYLNSASNIQYTGPIGISGDNAARLDLTANDGGNTGTGGGIDVVLGSVNVDINTLPSVTLTASTTSRPESNLGITTIFATLSKTHGSSVQVFLNFTGEATNDVDYTRSGTSITIPAGDISGTVSLTNIEDALFEEDETVVIDISSVTNGIENGTQQVTYTITNDDAQPNVTLEILNIYNPITDESGGQAYVRAKTNVAIGTTVSVPLIFSGTANGGGTDYSITGNTITLLPSTNIFGDPIISMDSIRVTSQFDGIEEFDETVVIDMGTPTNATEDGVQQVTLTILDEDTTIPSGYSVDMDLLGESSINVVNQNIIEFTGSNLEVGTTLNYSFTSNNGGTPVTGTETVTSVSQQFDNGGAGYDLSGLNDGLVTLTVSLTDPFDHTGADATSTATKDSAPPTGYSVSWDDNLINAIEATNTSFTLSGGEIGATLNYSISSTGDGNSATITGSVAVSNSPQSIPVNVSTLTDGTLTVTISLTDTRGNTGADASANNTILDQTPPVGYAASIDLIGEAIINGVNQSVIEIFGEDLEVGTILNYSFTSNNGGAPVTGTETVVSAFQNFDNGGVGYNLSGLADGIITLTYYLVDQAGNKGVTLTNTNTKDVNPPSGYSVVWNDNLINAIEATNTGFTVNNAELDAIISYSISSSGDGNTATLSGFATVTNVSQVVIVNVSSLLDGALTVSVTLMDANANTGSVVSDNSAILDQSATKPTTPDLVASSDSGISDTDNITNEITPTFEGIADANSTITIKSSIDGTLGTTTAIGTGQWSFTSGNLSSGVHSITVSSSDIAGNTNESDALLLTIDILAPTPILINGLTIQVDLNGNSPTLQASDFLASPLSDDYSAPANIQLELDKSTFDCSNVGVAPTDVRITATDEAGNSDFADTYVIVQDNIAPTARAKNIILNVDAFGSVTLAPSAVDDGSSDNCSITSRTLSKSEFTGADVGPNNVTLTVFDASGNLSSAVAVVTVVLVPKVLNVTANPGQSKVYGQADPTFTYTATGFEVGDDETILTGALSRAAGETVGVYAINQGDLRAGTNYSINFVPADFEITRAPINGITFADDSFVFDETAKSLAITGTLPTGTSVAYTNNGRTDVGTQEVTATITGSNYTTLELKADLTITPATITGVNFVDDSYVFDETVKSLAITGTLPAGTAVAYSNNSRTNVGTQEVTAIITGSNFTTLELKADLTITPATITGVTFVDDSFVFDGTSKSLAITGTLPTGTAVAYSNNIRTDVGTQEVTATITGSNYTTLELKADLTITPATVTGITFVDDSFVFDGTSKSLAITGTLPTGTAVAYTNNNRTDVGTQEVTATITGSNYTTLELKADLTIIPAALAGITFTDDSFVFDGTSKSLAISGALPAGAAVAYSNNIRTDVGTQEVTATITGSNYSTLELKADLTITPAAITGVTFVDDSFVFDGTSKSLAITGTLPTGTTVAYTNNGRTDVGTQEVTATITGSNFTTLELKANLTITEAALTITADSGQSKLFGESDPVLTFKASGFGAGDDEGIFTGSLIREPGEAVGMYVISLGTLDAGDNYTINYTGADFEIITNDTDKDGVPDDVEEDQGTDPKDPTDYKDEDGDDVPDYVEEKQGTNPTDPRDYEDTDGDDVPDYVEEQQGTDPENGEYFKDEDGDDVPNYIEEQNGTDPTDPKDYQDEDGDDVPDYVEEKQGTNPSDPGDYVDSDGDDVPDYVEEQQGTDPTDSEDFPDEDEDGLPDYVQTKAIEEFVDSSLEVLWGTEKADLKVPTDVVVITAQGVVINLPVIWDLTGYDAIMSGATNYSGTVELPAGLFNPNGLQPNLEITVLAKPAPQDVTLSANSFIAIPDQYFQDIGNFTVIDPSDDQHTLSLPEGIQDNEYFEVIDGILFWSSAEQAQGRTTFTIILRVTDIAGNVLEKSFQITRNRTPLDQLDVPNTFTPNNDGVNDTWGIPALRYYQGVRISIMDVGGNRVFYTENPDTRWDGAFDGKELPVGAYFWIIEVAETGEVRRGVLNLLRQ